MQTRALRVAAAVLLAALCGVPGCDDDGPVGTAAEVTGRWSYRAIELRGAQVVCSTSDIELSLQPEGALAGESRFSGTAFEFDLECSDGERTVTILFTGGSAVLNGEIRDGMVAFDFSDPDFLHTGTFTANSMGGTVATRIDLSGTPLVDLGIVNLIGEWEAVKD